ncbi:MAG: flavin monoamine oxidase family protein, partial [Massilia sp.]|nr:flavin monoamine oxidase family protein [Massilia sp.]
MANTLNDSKHTGSEGSRRNFLAKAMAVGGSGFLLASMKAWGMDTASTRTAPPMLQGSGKGKTVVILGAGLAGMTAAYELSKLGYTCKVVEARGFAGGRCQTARGGKVLEELGGEKQVCGFDKGQYINFGPWRIPFNHRSTLHYTSEFGVPLELFNNDNDAAYVYSENAKGALAGKRLRMFEVKADMRGYVDELLAKSLNSGLMDQQVNSADKALLIDYLVNEGYLSKKDLRYRGTEGRGFKVNPGAGVNPGPGVASDPLGFSDLLQSKLGHAYHSVHEFTQQATMLQPVGGMDQIAKAFELRVGKMIRYNTEVVSLRNLLDKVEVHVKDVVTGKASMIKGDFCLCTIPLSVWRHVEIDFSDKFKTALQGAAYAPVCKIGLQMNRRFWEQDDGIYGGHVFTDAKGINLISLPSGNWQGKKGT